MRLTARLEWKEARDMMIKDVRQWLQAADEDRELRAIKGAHWNLEMSGLVEILYREGARPLPLVLFDEIPGYPAGFRTLFGVLASPRRLARALCLPHSDDPTALLQSWRAKMRALKGIPPKVVGTGPVMENRLSGGEVNLEIFPSPFFHESDGGRYLGTGCSVILKDPDTGWVNVGTYRCMFVDRNRLALHMLESQHGAMINEKYFSRGKAAPVAVAIGVDPTLWFFSCDRMTPWGVSEYDYAGGTKGEPVEVIAAPYTGLPVPAHAEIVIEGECHPGELIDEGPFGEWHGYYANNALVPVPEPVIRVKGILHRNDPILTCAQPTVPPSEMTAMSSFSRAATLWDSLERFGITGIQGVWGHEEGGGLLFLVISIRQMYAGHSRRVGLTASQVSVSASRYIVVVDDDIDPSNLGQVIWAISTRCDPQRSIQILPSLGSSSNDTTISPEEKRKYQTPPKPLYSARAVIDACRPFEWRDEWYPLARISSELRGKLIDKWHDLLGPLGLKK